MPRVAGPACHGTARPVGMPRQARTYPRHTAHCERRRWKRAPGLALPHLEQLVHDGGRLLGRAALAVTPYTAAADPARAGVPRLLLGPELLEQQPQHLLKVECSFWGQDRAQGEE